MISVSTCWRSPVVRNGAQLLDTMTDAGAQAVELEYRITRRMFEQMEPRLDLGQVRVTSVHNYFPVPEILEDDRGGGDLFSFASEDDEERRLAIEYTIRSLRMAARVRAKVVVVHLSKVPMDNGVKQLKAFFDDGAIESVEARRYRKDFATTRRERAPRAFKRVLSSLDKLVLAADKYGVAIGVENRYHPNEIPDADEIGTILQTFQGAPIGYWHDIGHAVVQERLGILPQADLLEAHGGRLVGVHVHDVVGYDDHWAPGAGEVEFSDVTPYVPTDALKVIEVHPKVSRDELVTSLAFVGNAGFA